MSTTTTHIADEMHPIRVGYAAALAWGVETAKKSALRGQMRPTA